ncbi:hypothetical protein Dsin_013644 [Dipteronia sinensis]|uniref:EGF-like domain-containing protein n=1 Tax=Dipteronia sinensis TaxID=43782 RepID=A0AAE0ALK0_9ROSI|nr:hypothetical protein Dsin_013644 [Dipteronia sinensis]
MRFFFLKSIGLLVVDCDSYSFLNCGEGSCVNSKASLLGYDCVCKPGWKNIRIGDFTFPSCVMPNCTVNFNCTDGFQPPPPGQPPVLPPFNLSDCSLGRDCNGLGQGLPSTPTKSGSAGNVSNWDLGEEDKYKNRSGQGKSGGQGAHVANEDCSSYENYI